MQSLTFPAIAHTLDRAEAPGIACHIYSINKSQPSRRKAVTNLSNFLWISLDRFLKGSL